MKYAVGWMLITLAFLASLNPYLLIFSAPVFLSESD
jgi:ABC-type uncharacterized transport system permease subunit